MCQTPLTLSQVRTTELVWIELISTGDVFPALLNDVAHLTVTYKRRKADMMTLRYWDYGKTWRVWEHEPTGRDMQEAT